MKLSKQAVKKILSKEDASLRLALAASLKFTEAWVTSLAKKNKENGPLTTVVAVAIIRNAGLKQSEILEEKELAKAV
jgi:hypothetical protein